MLGFSAKHLKVKLPGKDPAISRTQENKSTNNYIVRKVEFFSARHVWPQIRE